MKTKHSDKAKWFLNGIVVCFTCPTGDLILNSGEELKINTTAPSITFSSYNYTASLQNRSSLHGRHLVADITFSGNIEFRSGSVVEVIGKYALSITSLSENILIQTDVNITCGETVFNTTCLGGFTQSSSPVMVGIRLPKTDAIFEGLGTGGLEITIKTFNIRRQCIPGSSHGGKAQYGSVLLSGPSYGKNDPTSLLGGSGGSCLHTSGSVAGGGAIELVAEKGEITINASIIASAQTAGSSSICSGGSGGLIRLKAQKVQIQEKGRLSVEGGNGQQPSNTYLLGGGAGGIIQIIASEGSLAANTSSMKHGSSTYGGVGCDAEDGYFLLKVNDTASPSSVNLKQPYSWPPTTPLATSTGLVLNRGEVLQINTTVPFINCTSCSYSSSVQTRRSLYGSHLVANITFSGNIEFRSGSIVEVFGKYALSITSLNGNISIQTDVNMTCGKTVLNTTCLGGFTQSSSPVMVGRPYPPNSEIHFYKGLGPGGLDVIDPVFRVSGQCISGSSHGGKAQSSSSFIDSGPSYDQNNTKSLLGGSGGSCLRKSGSVAGGGAIELVAEKGAIIINASIIASAQTADNLSICSGGSGGLIRLKAQKVQIQEKGRLSVEGGNGQEPSNMYILGGGAGGIIQIIASEGRLAANTSSMKHGENSFYFARCVAEDGYFLLKVNETASPASVDLTQPYSWPPTSSNSWAVATTPLATSTATESILTAKPWYISTTVLSFQPSVSPTPDGKSCQRKPDLVAIIYGGTEVIRGHQQNITVNASLSHDPDVGLGNHSGMNFTWYYGEITGNYSGLRTTMEDSFTGVNQSSIRYFGNDSGLEATLSTSSMLVNKTYAVKLVVSKDCRSSTSYQLIHLVKGDPPEISQRCQINCKPEISPSVKLSIKSQCHGPKCSKISSYEWILYQEYSFVPYTDIIWVKKELKLITDTPLNSRSIVIKKDSLESGKNYWLAHLIRTSDGQTRNECLCSVISWLPPGNRSDNFTVKFVATVTDKYGASAPAVNLSVQVKPSLLLRPGKITKFLRANDSLFNKLIKDGDLSKAAQIENTILQAVSRDTAMDSEQKSRIQDFIIKSIISLQVKSIPDLLQISSVIGSGLRETETVSSTSLASSLSAINNMTSLLWRTAQLKDVADIPLIIQSAENLGSCLNSLLKAGAVIASGDLGSGLQEQGKTLVTTSMKIISLVGDALLALSVPDEKVISIGIKELTITLGRHSPDKLVGMKIEGGNGRFVLPTDERALNLSRITGSSFIDTQMLSIPFNPYTWDSTKQRVNSDVLALDLKDERRNVIKLANLSNGVTVITPLKPRTISSENPQYFANNDNLRFHKIDVENDNTFIIVEITPGEASTHLIVYMRYGQRPTTKEHDLNATVSSNGRCVWTLTARGKKDGKTECSFNQSLPIKTLAKRPGKYFLGVQSYEKILNNSHKRKKRSCFGNRREKRSCVEVKDPPPTPAQSKNVTVVPVYDSKTDQNYTLRVALGSCVYWSEEREMWITDGCQVLSATLNGFINCSCNHLTSFGGDLSVKPNPIDFDKVLVQFKNIEENGNVAVIVTVAVVLVCYFTVLVIARKADKVDARYNVLPVQLTSTANSLHEYEIVITTGVWTNSGTTAKVAIEIYGAENSTGIIQLTSEEPGVDKFLFSRGNTDVFVFYVHNRLGAIQGVRIGHDNSGESPSWFLEEIVIVDKAVDQSWAFASSQWLALEREDGRIERMIEQVPNQLHFSHEVVKRWWKGLTEMHIWISVVAKARRNRFTRVQRASCCLSVLLTAMLANAMFYKLVSKSEQGIQLGPLKFSSRQVMIGIKSMLIIAPINILITFLFQKGSGKSTIESRCCSKVKWLTYLAWFFFVCSCTLSVTFTIFYSLTWGKSISEQWLSSMFISFTQDVIIMEPFKVFFIALMLAVILKWKTSRHKENESIDEGEHSFSQHRLWTLKLTEVEEMRKRQARKQNLSRFFVELVFYVIFVFLLMVVCYGNRNDHRYLMTKSIRDGLPHFHKAVNNTKYWSWLNDVFVPSVFAGRWYNGQQENQTMYIGNKRSVLVGMARARQLRVKPTSCNIMADITKISPVCYEGYSEANEERRAFSKPGWKPIKNVTSRDELLLACPKPWRYQSAGESHTGTKWGQFSLYPGGGYIADLGYNTATAVSVIKNLQKYDWLDRQTRAVVVEFSTFNPSVNVLGIGTYFFEVEASGYRAPFTKTEVISLYSTETASRPLYLICALLFVVFVLLYLGRECYKLWEQRSRYFKSFWNWLEIFQMVLSITAIAMHIVQSDRITLVIRKLQQNVYANINFREADIWCEAENAVLGILTFTVTVKLLRLIRFNKQVALFAKTVKISARHLSSFVVVFLILFVAFLHFGIMTFGTGSEQYSSVLRGTFFQLELTLGRVRARPINELAAINKTLGRIFCVTILAIITILLINFFIVILNDALVEAKDAAKENELFDLVDECKWKSTRERKAFFDAISNSLRRVNINENSKTDATTPEGNSRNSSTINFDLISQAIRASREQMIQGSANEKPRNQRRKCSFDKVSNIIGGLKDVNSEDRHNNKKKGKKVRFKEHVTNSQLGRLQKTKRVLFQRLDNIVQGHAEEEKTFHFLCHKMGIFKSLDQLLVGEKSQDL
ncbi:hypothetical protein ACROYT_G013694 [Oculina patagonica]